MSTPDSQEQLKEEAKSIRLKLDKLLRADDKKALMMRLVCVYAGMITETLIDYEEPDVVMEQAFHRIADLLQTEPAEDDAAEDFMPLASDIDRDTEIGRQLAQITATRLPKELDDVHEIAIALVLDTASAWDEDKPGRDIMLRILAEAVVASLTYEMAAQDFCDFLIEDLVTEGFSPGEAIFGLSAVAGSYFAEASYTDALDDKAEESLWQVMAREAVLHGTPGTKNWQPLAASNDTENIRLRAYMETMRPETDKFFEMIGLEDSFGQAVAVAKAVGRMVAVVTVEDIGQIHPSIAKSLAKTGMILGSRYRADIVH
ncbi:MAG: hypothetical protein OXT65_00120 [Alphaproteobacteria bacterium]|nr:hypothetical protein [Alphaproteobacteria bacterium]